MASGSYDHPTEPGPTELDTTERLSHFLEISKDKLTVSYKGRGSHSDVGTVRANRPCPQKRVVYYFETRILSLGTSKTTVTIGVSPIHALPNQLPGIQVGSVGFIGDGLRKYTGDNRPETYASGVPSSQAAAAASGIGGNIRSSIPVGNNNSDRRNSANTGQAGVNNGRSSGTVGTVNPSSAITPRGSPRLGAAGIGTAVTTNNSGNNRNSSTAANNNNSSTATAGNDGTTGSGNNQSLASSSTNFEVNDVIGVGLDYISNIVFFTRNGFFLGTAAPLPNQHRLYPSIGLHSPGEKIQVIFENHIHGGSTNSPFMYDIVSYRKNVVLGERADILGQVPPSETALNRLVRSYLVHGGYADTLKEFDTGVWTPEGLYEFKGNSIAGGRDSSQSGAVSGSPKGGKGSASMTGGRKGDSKVGSGSTGTDSSTMTRDRFLEQSLEWRKQLRSLLAQGKFNEVKTLLKDGSEGWEGYEAKCPEFFNVYGLGKKPGTNAGRSGLQDATDRDVNMDSDDADNPDSTQQEEDMEDINDRNDGTASSLDEVCPDLLPLTLFHTQNFLENYVCGRRVEAIQILNGELAELRNRLRANIENFNKSQRELTSNLRDRLDSRDSTINNNNSKNTDSKNSHSNKNIGTSKNTNNSTSKVKDDPGSPRNTLSTLNSNKNSAGNRTSPTALKIIEECCCVLSYRELSEIGDISNSSSNRGSSPGSRSGKQVVQEGPVILSSVEIEHKLRNVPEFIKTLLHPSRRQLVVDQVHGRVVELLLLKENKRRGLENSSGGGNLFLPCAFLDDEKDEKKNSLFSRKKSKGPADILNIPLHWDALSVLARQLVSVRRNLHDQNERRGPIPCARRLLLGGQSDGC